MGKNLKTVGLLVLAMALMITLTACDMGDSSSTEETGSYDVDLVIYSAEGLTGNDEAAIEFAEELDVFVEEGIVGEFTYQDNGSVVATIEDISDGTSISVEHPEEDLNQTFHRGSRSQDDMVVAHGTLELEAEMDSIQFPQNPLWIHRLEIKESIEGSIENLALLSGDGDLVASKELEEPLYTTGSADGEEETIALLTDEGRIVAESKVNISDESDSLELELVSAGKLHDLGSEKNISQQNNDYWTAKYTIDYDDDVEEKQVALVDSGDDPLEEDLNDGYAVINHIAIDLEYAFDDGDDGYDLFFNLFEEEYFKHDYDTDNMNLYVKADNGMRPADDEDAEDIDYDEAETVKMGIIEYYDDDGEWHNRPAATISYSRDTAYSDGNDGEVYEYTVTVHEVNDALPDAESFTIGSADDGTPAEIGEEMSRLVKNDNGDGDKIDLFIFEDLDMTEPEGDGTEDAPYQIRTAKQLDRFVRRVGTPPQSNDDDYESDGPYFKLKQDIDLAEIEDWHPIGSSSDRPFEGTLDGGEHELENLEVVGSGFIGHLEGNIKRLELHNFTVDGNSFVGIVAGINKGNISNIRITGDSSVNSASNYTGAIAGENKDSGTIAQVKVEEDIEVSSAGDYVGGLVGANRSDSNIEESYSYAAVEGIDTVGGLVGLNEGSIEGGDNGNSLEFDEYATYASGEVTGINEVGGLVGFNTGEISQAAAAGDVTGDEGYDVGGLVGRNGNSDSSDEGEIEYSLAVGNVEGYNSVGGLVGTNEYGILTDSEANNSESSVVANQHNAGGLVGHNMAEAYVGNSDARGDVSAARMRAGGIAGRNDATEVEEDEKGIKDSSHGEGAIDGTRYVGKAIGLAMDEDGHEDLKVNEDGDTDLPDDSDERDTIGGEDGGKIGAYSDEADIAQATINSLDEVWMGDESITVSSIDFENVSDDNVYVDVEDDGGNSIISGSTLETVSTTNESKNIDLDEIESDSIETIVYENEDNGNGENQLASKRTDVLKATIEVTECEDDNGNWQSITANIKVADYDDYTSATAILFDSSDDRAHDSGKELDSGENNNTDLKFEEEISTSDAIDIRVYKEDQVESQKLESKMVEWGDCNN